jgi:hypothetical protein
VFNDGEMLLVDSAIRENVRARWLSRVAQGVRAVDLDVDCDSPIVALTAKTLTGETVAGATSVTATTCKP